MIRDHDCIMLTTDVPGSYLKSGDIGVVIHTHTAAIAYEVEFFDSDGNTIAIETIMSADLKSVELSRPV